MALAPLGVAPVHAQAVQVTPLTLYYHNDTSNPMIANFTRATAVLNTTTNWSPGPQLWPPSSGSFSFLFYLEPSLEAPVTLNGTILLHPWVSGNTTGGSLPSASFSLTIYEVASSGFIWTASAMGPGRVDVASSPTDVNKLPSNSGRQLLYSVATHTFAMGDSIGIGVTASPSSGTTLKFYYDAVSTPSYVGVFSSDHAGITRIWYTDEFGNPASSFIARDTGILTVNTVATDPLGMYDVELPPVGSRDPNVRFDALTPSGTPLLAYASIFVVQGTPRGPNGTFAFTLRIPDASGTYSLTIRILDNSGNIFAQTAQLLIVEGFRLAVRVSDSQGHPVSGAWVQVFTANGVPYDFKATNSSGAVTFKVPSGSYQVLVSYTTTYMMTQFSSGSSAVAQSVNSNTTISLKISSYPPPFASTILYTLILWGTILPAAGIIAIVAVTRRKQLSSRLQSLSKSVKRGYSGLRRGPGPPANYCTYCGSSLGPGAASCVICGKAVPRMSL